jgi:hypothetical protein
MPPALFPVEAWAELSVLCSLGINGRLHREQILISLEEKCVPLHLCKVHASCVVVWGKSVELVRRFRQC